MDQFAALHSGNDWSAGVGPLVEGKQNAQSARCSPDRMKRQSWILLICAMALIGLTAGFLSRQQSNQKLGIPGVKVVAEPTYDVNGKLVASNTVYLPTNVLSYQSENRPITEDTLSWLPKDTTYDRRLYTAQDGVTAAPSFVLIGRGRTSIQRPERC